MGWAGTITSILSYEFSRDSLVMEIYSDGGLLEQLETCLGVSLYILVSIFLRICHEYPHE